MFGISLGMIVESSVSILLAVTIGYCVILNARLKRLHSDRDTLGKMVADLVQATTLANAAVIELKKTAIEADQRINERIAEAEKFEAELAAQVGLGSQLVEKIARITAAAKIMPLPEPVKAEAPKPEPVKAEPVQGRLASALQQLAMRPGIGGKAA